MLLSHKARGISTVVATNITFQEPKVSREERWKALGHHHNGTRGCTLWFTGLSGAGKTTIAFTLEKILIQLGIPAYGLDGDNIRHGLCKNLGFDKDARSENIRRVAEVAKLFADMGTIAIASFISPYRRDREEARRIHKEMDLDFYEIHVNTPLEVCEARDPKRLYEKARAGKIASFTGIGSAYEVPTRPDLTINTAERSEAECVHEVLQFLYDRGILSDKALFKLCGVPLRPLFVQDESVKRRLLAESKHSPSIELTLQDLQWLQVLAEGWASPLGGFMRERQYLQALHYGQFFDLKKGRERDSDELDKSGLQKSLLANGGGEIVNNGKQLVGRQNSLNTSNFLNTSNLSIGSIGDASMLAMMDNAGGDTGEWVSEPINQSVPIVLAISDAQRKSLFIGESEKLLVPAVNLLFGGRLVAVLTDPEVFPHRKEERICRQFGVPPTVAHPVIQQIMASGDWLIGGEIQVFDRIRFNDGLDEYRKTPLELRETFMEMGADAVFAFQVRNPLHNGHVLLNKITREQLLERGYRNPVLLLHPLGGWTKSDDVPLAVRIAQHRALLDSGALDARGTVLAIFPSPMLYAGPTEVQWHARARLVCGAKFYIVGRDPAGIQDPRTGGFLYDPEHGAKVLSMAPGLPGLEILPFKVAAYNTHNKRMEFFEEERRDEFQFISGTLMRGLARRGEQPPDGFMAPEAWEVLASHYRNGAETTIDQQDDKEKKATDGDKNGGQMMVN